MAEGSGKRIYATQDQQRFYWIPDDAGLPEGSLALRTLTGKRLDVDPAAAAPYEVAEDEAKRIVSEEMAVYARKAQSLLGGAAASLREALKKPPVDRPERPKREATLANALGITEEQLRTDPTAVMGALQETLKGLMTTLKEGTSDDPAERERARRRMEIVTELVKQETGTELEPDEIPNKIRDFLSNPELERQIREATGKLERAAAELRADRRKG